MASSTPSAPSNSSRVAADRTAGRIYFSTPSAQVRIPVGDLFFFDPPLLLTLYYYWGKNFPVAEQLSGGKNYKGASADGRRRNNYPRRAQVSKISKKKSQGAQNCRTVPK